MQYRRSNGQLVTLASSAALGIGGEARIFVVSDPHGCAAKVYHRPTPQHAAKLRAMLANPPDDPMAARGHVSIAWPREVLVAPDGSGRVLGFLMGLVSGMSPVIDFYHPKTRRREHPLFNYRYLLHTARNVAACLRALHDRGYVVGDLNESNILVADTSLVTLVDTDSFQVPDPGRGHVYRCPVGKPEFTPPEIQGVDFSHVDRQVEHDLFGLGVLIFQLLMEGTHPFAGRHTGAGEPPLLEERIAGGQFPYAGGHRNRSLPMPTAPPFEALDPTVRGLFLRCFADGHSRPQERPDARTWQLALETAEDCLKTCPVNEQHQYGRHLASCPWCQRREALGGLDPFPSREAVQRHSHLQPVRPVGRTPAIAVKTQRATPTAAPRPIPPRVKPRWALRAALVLILLAVVMMGLYWFLRPGPPPTRVPSEPTPVMPTGTSTPGAEPVPVVAAEPQEDQPVKAAEVEPQRAVSEPPSPLAGQNLVVADLGMTLVYIEPGSFQMGSNSGDNDEKPVHTVRISRAFWMSQCEVTQAQYQAVTGSDPSSFKGSDLPVENVSWDDAVAFCRRLTDRERQAGRLPAGHVYRLPTEAEWEYAVRGGSKNGGFEYAGSNSLDEVAWNSSNSGSRTHPVGQKKANELGLYDMSGNVWEWCRDAYDASYYATSPASDPTGPASSGLRVLRGGSWVINPGYCRVTLRGWGSPGYRSRYYGFRVVASRPLD